MWLAPFAYLLDMTTEFGFTRGWRLLALTYFVFAPLSALAATGLMEAPPEDSCFIDLSSPEELRQQNIATGHRVRTNDYTTDRTYSHYKEELSSNKTPSLKELIDNLHNGSVLFDNGTGMAKAVRLLARSPGYQAKFRKLIGSTFNEIKDASQTDKDMLAYDIETLRDRFEYIYSGDLDAALANPSHPIQNWLGQIDLLIEDFGPTSYADLNIAFEWIARLMKPGAHGLINLSVKNEFIMGNKRLSAEEFFVLLPRLTNGRLIVENFGPYRDESYYVIHLRRVELAMPQSQRLQFSIVKMIDDTPPERGWDLVPYKPSPLRQQGGPK